MIFSSSLSFRFEYQLKVKSKDFVCTIIRFCESKQRSIERDRFSITNMSLTSIDAVSAGDQVKESQKGIKTRGRRRLTFVQVLNYSGFRFLYLQNIQTSWFLRQYFMTQVIPASRFWFSVFEILMEAQISLRTCEEHLCLFYSLSIRPVT